MTTIHANLDRIAHISTGYQHRGKAGEGAAPTHRLVRISAIGDRCPTLDSARCAPFSPASEVGDALLRPGDVVLATRGERRRAALVAESNGAPLVASEQVAILRAAPEVEPRYLAWALNSPACQRQLDALSRGSNIPFVASSDLGELRIPLPPIETQRRLAALAGLVERERDLAQRLAERRLALTYAIMGQVAHDFPDAAPVEKTA